MHHIKVKLLAISLLILAIVAALALYLRDKTIAVLQPQGSVGVHEKNLIIFAVVLSFIVVLPVFALTFYISWKYRENNTHAKYSPDWDHSRKLETVWWVIPGVLILILSVVTWQSSHALDPFKPLAGDTKPINIQVVALDWKWLFIYPDLNIASVNYMQVPVNTPINFHITADAPMNSFWIPQLGGQIYAMPGMSTQLHLKADKAGSYRGSSANISGSGFSGMVFTADAGSNMQFKEWVNSVKQASKPLNQNSYSQLALASKNNPPSFYSWVEPGMYDSITMKYMSPISSNQSTNTKSVYSMPTTEMQ